MHKCEEHILEYNNQQQRACILVSRHKMGSFCIEKQPFQSTAECVIFLWRRGAKVANLPTKLFWYVGEIFREINVSVNFKSPIYEIATILSC